MRVGLQAEDKCFTVHVALGISHHRPRKYARVDAYVFEGHRRGAMHAELVDQSIHDGGGFVGVLINPLKAQQQTLSIQRRHILPE